MIKFDFPLPLDHSARVAIAFGVFDGVHLGHRRIIAELVRMSVRLRALPLAVTFVPHPRTLLDPEHPVELLLPLAERLRLLRQAGAEGVGIIDFSPDFAAMEPEVFLEQLIRSGTFGLAGVCVGNHWRFGRGGRGGRELLAGFCQARGLAFKACAKYTVGHRVVSSSAIRRAVAGGDLAGARAMLGAEVRLFGFIRRGRGVAGSALSAPTANLELESGVLPPDGVYSASVKLESGSFPAAVNIGIAPTFSELGCERRIEAHLLDYSGDLYGKYVELSLLRFLRPERKFSSPEELKRQIALDVSVIRADCSSGRRK